jgi:adenosylhomocysteine nucleosidase
VSVPGDTIFFKSLNIKNKVKQLSLIVAMESERQAVMQLLGGKECGPVGNCYVRLHQSGIGKVNAAIATLNIIRREHPDYVLSTGVAGGIDNKLQVMDVVAGSETCYHDVWCGPGNDKGQVQGLPTRYQGDASLLADAKRLDLRCGLICTGDQFITDRSSLNKIKDDFPDGLAVDMESAAIAQTCYLNEVPFMSLRIVSDTPGNTPDHMAQYKDFWATLSQKSFLTLRNFLEQIEA